MWDHLVQDFDSTAPNFGVVADHPELIDFNYISGNRVTEDWNHTNSIDYNPELEQILVSVHSFNEIWVIDHSTTAEEAAGHTGGTGGKGGDLLYRWGNPQTYGAGTANDEQLFGQHDAKWIEAGLPGQGNIMVFNNGQPRLQPYSTVVEITPPVTTTAGQYSLSPGTAYGPDSPTWEYVADDPQTFFATNISGAQRLSNGNTIICDGPGGRFFEVTSTGDVVWEYVIPTANQGQDGEGANVFRAERYALDFPGLVDRVLVASSTVPAVASAGPPQGRPDQSIMGSNYRAEVGVNFPATSRRVDALPLAGEDPPGYPPDDVRNCCQPSAGYSSRLIAPTSLRNWAMRSGVEPRLLPRSLWCFL